MEPGDLIYDALKKRGLIRPEHSTQIASNIKDDKDYDQILFAPGPTKDAATGKIGVFAGVQDEGAVSLVCAILSVRSLAAVGGVSDWVGR